jgi:hypothetical protein
MPARLRRCIPACLALPLLLASACASTRPAASPAGGDAALVREAEAFMQGYARDLRAGAREQLVARYHPDGAYLLGAGSKQFMPVDSIRALYLGGWQPPASFDWGDLSFVPAGPGAVVVAGLFFWTPSAGGRFQYSYSSLLVRHAGGLRIRVEDESPLPSPR